MTGKSVTHVPYVNHSLYIYVMCAMWWERIAVPRCAGVCCIHYYLVIFFHKCMGRQTVMIVIVMVVVVVVAI